jgi:hypothetical protein
MTKTLTKTPVQSDLALIIVAFYADRPLPDGSILYVIMSKPLDTVSRSPFPLCSSTLSVLTLASLGVM